MARKVTFGDTNFAWSVEPRTKSTTLEYTGEGAATVQINVPDLIGSGYNIGGYRNFAVRKGNNLVITTVFINETNYKTKVVTTTIKDYFKEGVPEITVNYTSGEDIWLGVDTDYTITPSTTIGTNGLYGEGDEKYITTPSGNSMNVTVSEKIIYNEKGNYTYNATVETIPPSNNTVFDLAGNDKYNIKNHGLNVLEFKGNDNYNLAGTAALIVNDIKGNDKYSATGASHAYIEDWAGKDTYNFNNHTGSITIGDSTGSDKYYLNKVESAFYFYNANITDIEGKDLYEITQSRGIEISDFSGNDKYVVKNCSNLFEDEIMGDDRTIRLADYLGNDKYTFENVSGYSDWVKLVTDNAGKDTYTFNNVSKAWVFDEGTGNDKFTLTGCTDFEVANFNSADKDSYIIKDSDKILILDNGGTDKYNIKTSDKIEIQDEGASDKDSYKIDKLYSGTELVIHDDGGIKDSLTVSSLNKNNLGIVFDLTKDDNGAVYLVDISTGGYIKIDNYFSQNDENFELEGLGDGCIETVKAGLKITSNNVANYIDNINSLQAEMVSWIGGTSYGSIEEVLQAGAINEMLQQHLVVTQEWF